MRLFSVLLFVLALAVSVAAQSKPMPELENPVPIGVEAVTFCNGEIDAVFEYWASVDTQDADFPKYIIVRLADDDRPFILILISDPFNTDPEFVVYVDHNGDGNIDM